MKRSTLLHALNVAAMLSMAQAGAPLVVRSRTDLEKDMPEPRLALSGNDSHRDKRATVHTKSGPKSSAGSMKIHCKRGYKPSRMIANHRRR